MKILIEVEEEDEAKSLLDYVNRTSGPLDLMDKSYESIIWIKSAEEVKENSESEGSTQCSESGNRPETGYFKPGPY